MKGVSKRLYIFFTVLLLFDGQILCSQNARKAFKSIYHQGFELGEESPEEALGLIKKAYDFAFESGDLWGMGIARAGTGFIRYSQGYYQIAYLDYLDALEAFSDSDTSDLSNTIIVLNELSLIQSNFGNHDESIAFSEQALSMSKEYIQKYPKHARQNDQLKWLIDIPYYPLGELSDLNFKVVDISVEFKSVKELYSCHCSNFR